MKKLFLAAVTLCTIGATQAQSIKIGLKGGVNYATFAGDVQETDGLIGFVAGGFVNVKINDKFSFQPELLYSLQGSGEKSTGTIFGTTFNYEDKTELGYINVPLMFKLNVIEGFSVEVGPQIGFLLSADRKRTSTSTTNGSTKSQETSTDVKDNYKETDFGVNFGLGFDLSKNINAGVRYNLGLTNILKDSSNFTVNNSVFTLALGYSF